MILTGPEIREQVRLGREREGKERKIQLPSPRSENLVYDVDCYKYVVDERMNYIDVEPYEKSLVGPNSIDLRLGDELLVYEDGFERHNRYESSRGARAFIHDAISLEDVLDLKAENKTHAFKIPEGGLILWPGILYLGRTIEIIGSNAFVPIVEGRSSVGRLGVHVHVTAGFCDLGFRGSITLEIHALHPIRIYPNLPICQAYFLEPRGAIELYKGRYQGQVDPTASRFGQDL